LFLFTEPGEEFRTYVENQVSCRKAGYQPLSRVRTTRFYNWLLLDGNLLMVSDGPYERRISQCNFVIVATYAVIRSNQNALDSASQLMTAYLARQR
jgi:hypothetical protein